MDESMIVGVVAVVVLYGIIVPGGKAFLAFLKARNERKNAPPIPEGFATSAPEDYSNPESEVRSWWQKSRRAFIAVGGNDGRMRYYDVDTLPNPLATDIIKGAVGGKGSVKVLRKGDDGKWSESEVNMSAVVQEHFGLRALYRPVWNYAMSGLKWGAVLGAILKLVGTAIELMSVEPGAGLCFLVAAALCLNPRIGVIAIVIASAVMSQIYEANFFIIGLSSAVTGAILGLLPGLTVGGIIGLSRRKNLPLAPDAVKEGPYLAFKVVLLPLIGSIIVGVAYVFLNLYVLSRFLKQ